MRKKFYTLREAAQLCGCTTNTIRRYIRDELVEPYWGRSGGSVIAISEANRREGFLFDSKLLQRIKEIKEAKATRLRDGLDSYHRDRKRNYRRAV
jgi:DNA-binding transcriptional MerR regulator